MTIELKSKADSPRENLRNFKNKIGRALSKDLEIKFESQEELIDAIEIISLYLTNFSKMHQRNWPVTYTNSRDGLRYYVILREKKAFGNAIKKLIPNIYRLKEVLSPKTLEQFQRV